MKNFILTIIKNEQEYLEEFIIYHLNHGINHIIIFEDIDSKSHKEIVDKYSSKVTLINILDVFDESEKERVIYEKTHLFKMQDKYSRKAMEYVKKHYECDWCFVMDIDEYITIDEKYNDLSEVLNEFINYDAVVLYWENYGANGLIWKPDYSKRGIMETYIQKAGFQHSDNPRDLCKVAYNMKDYTPEKYKNYRETKDRIKWCNTDFIQDEESIVLDKIYLRHYITKSWEEYVWKLKVRGMFYMSHRKYDSFFEMNPDMLDRKDELIELADKIIDKYKE